MSVESSDVGSYTCNATNVVSTDTSSGVLTVNVAPNISMPFEGEQLNITKGSNGSITCTATGYPVPTVVWQNINGSSLLNNRLVSASPMSSFTGVGNVSSVSVELIVIGALGVDTGMYRCLATNAIYNTTRNITITVQEESVCQPDLVTCVSELYPFGTDNDEAFQDTSKSDDFKLPFSLPETFQFYGTTIRTLYVHSNGIISFTNSSIHHTAERLPIIATEFIAPYWANVDIRGVGQIYYRQTNNSTLLARATNEIRAAFPTSKNVKLTSLFIVTWHAVGYFNHSIDKQNTFQCVLISSVKETFVMFLYPDKRIEWTTAYVSRGVSALAGINAGDGVNSITLPGSLTPSIVNITQTSNVGIPGIWMFKVDGVPAVIKVMDQAENEGNSAYFICQVTSEPIPSISWYFNDVPVDEANTMKYSITISSNTTTITNTLTIMSVESSDVGTYTCNATNVVSTDASSGVLTVNVAPNISISFEEQEFNITEGSNGSITCTAKGYPVPTVVWQNSDGSRLLNSTLKSVNATILSTGVGNVSSISVELQIIGASRVDTGMYTCFANNNISNTSRNIIITVQFPPVINSKVMDKVENEGNTTFFICQATGEPVPFINWYFNGVPLDEANTMKYNITMSSNTTSITNTLTIMSVESSDVGTYTCNATNEVSTDTSSGVLMVNAFVYFNQSTYNVNENIGSLQPVLILSSPLSSDITLQVITNDITATGGIDYNPGPYDVTFSANRTIASFIIIIYNDNITEGDEEFKLTIDTNLLNDSIIAHILSTATVIIMMNDDASSSQSPPENNNVVMIIIYVAVPCVVIISIVISIFIYKRRRVTLKLCIECRQRTSHDSSIPIVDLPPIGYNTFEKNHKISISHLDESHSPNKSKHDNVIRNEEPCPLSLSESNIKTVYFTNTGGVIDIEEYGVKVSVPSGAIEEHCMIEIQAAASLFGPFDIPNDWHPVSAYVWIGANYTFKEIIQIEFEHHADISNSENISNLCILKACCTKSCIKCNDHRHMMHRLTQGYCISESVCTLSTNHFCSLCLAAKSKTVPDRIVIYHYLSKDYKSADEIRSEVCFCYDINHCKQITEDRFEERKMLNLLLLSHCATLTNTHELHLCEPNDVKGWTVVQVSKVIKASEIDFRKRYKSKEDLEADEKRDIYPPRFITHLNRHKRSTLDVTFILKIMKDSNNMESDYKINIYAYKKAAPHEVNTAKMGLTEEQSYKSPERSPSIRTITSSESGHVASPGEKLEQSLKTCPTLKELNPYISRMALNYYNIGLELDIVTSKLRNIQYNSKLPRFEEKCQEMLNLWLESDTSATWEKLCVALERTDQSVLAEELKKLVI